MAKQPKWAIPARQKHLVKLFAQSQGFCVFGHTPCRGNWQAQTSVVCSWGKPCNNPNPDGMCRHKPNDGKPHLPCQIIHVTISRWTCAYGDYPCYAPFESHYECYGDRLVKAWVSDDRAQSLAEYHAEFEARHKTNDRRYPLHGKFSGVSQDVFYDKQPEFFIEGLGISGLTYKPFASKATFISSNQALPNRHD